MEDGATDALEGDGWREEGTRQEGERVGAEGCDLEGVLAQETHGQCAWTGAWRAATGAREGTWAWVEGGRENKETAEVRSSACSRQCREGPGERGEVWSEGHEDA